ncbi:MAG: L-lactate dehydrogenase (quinone) large subunit LdhH [Desulfobaccales bacterium]
MIDTAQNLQEYKKRLKQALDNKFLRSAMGTFATAYKDAQARIFQGVDVEALRREIARGKDEALPRLEELYETFKARAEAAGAKVHLAATAHEANAIIAAIAQEHQVRKVVKSKSMTAEETFLNHHLEAEGLEVVETDLGEWIIQLRHEGPSHMVMPAIHLSRQEVADLFAQVTGEPQEPDIGNLVKVARQELRKAFLTADMGISGANFAIAETGTLGIISNEGNARLVTTLPRVHVALVGVDKLLPDLHAALRILKILPPRATGQTITSYVSWITGANECRPGPGGKKEMHIVFLDNGRLALSRDPVFSQALRCVRCGSCANVCPIYGLVGGHNYGHVYIGAIGLILTYFYHGRANARAIVQNCLNCQACKAVCPAGIDLPRLIKEVHGEILAQEGAKPLKNRLLGRVLQNRRLFHFLLRRASLAQKPLTRGGDMIRHLPFFFGKEHGFRSLPAIARIPFRDRWQNFYQPPAHPRYRVGLFGGCLVDFVYPEQGEALLKLLQDHQVQVDYPQGQTCCGLPAKMMGEPEIAKEVARQNLAALDPADYDYILTLCASCGSHLKEAYPQLLAKEAGLGVKAKQFATKVIDFSSFMTDVLKVKPEQFLAGGRKVAYHAPCHLCRGMGVMAAPRDLLKTVGLEYLPARDEDVCCGMAGSYSVDFPELSAELLKKKLDAVAETGAELLVTDCPGCVLQLKGGMDKRGGKVKVMHIAEAVAEAKKDPQQH